jgi:hypothetical protein
MATAAVCVFSDSTNVDSYPSGRRGCARSSLDYSSSGENSIPLSLFQNPKLIVATCRTPKFTFSTPVILRWTLPPTRSLRC